VAVDLLLILIVVLIAVLIWRGPSMLPQIGEALGKAVKGARDNMDRDRSQPGPDESRPDDDSPTSGQ
jgi:Sec-independent protein translocase protein TatA